MVTRLASLSISRTVKKHLPLQRQVEWRVLAVFQHACDLEAPSGAIVALVLPEIGDGPLNIVVTGWPGLFATVELGTPAWSDETTLYLGNLEIHFSAAAVWEPRPDWKLLRQSKERIQNRLLHIQDLASRLAPSDSLIMGRATKSPYVQTVREAAQAMPDVWAGRWSTREEMEGIAARLAGLGSGLTPAGDDFLLGVMLRAWLAHPEPQTFCQALLAVAASQTNKLSAAFLRAGARGECGIAWHDLFDALQSGTNGELLEAVKRIIAHGHTSGADMLAGFLGPG